MTKLLIIDDDQGMIDTLSGDIQAELGDDIDCVGCNFQESEEKISDCSPDVVVLDLLLGGDVPGAEKPGLNVREFIWDNCFCPIIIHSAEPSYHDDLWGEHPFIKSIQKGRHSPSEVIQALQGFEPHIEALKNAHNEIEGSFRKSLSQVMRDVAPQVFDAIDEGERQKQLDTLTRAGKRRLANLMDQPLVHEIVAPWEMYLCPPMAKHIRLGDIIRKAGQAPDNNQEVGEPTDYFIVLTPSCDLEENDGRAAKVENVLVAQCISAKKGLARIGKTLSPNENRAREVVGDLLTHSHQDGTVFLPSYFEKLPTMAADLKNLHLIPIENIGLNEEYVRVASVDSPFREAISWAYVQTAGRPGVPDRDFDLWSKEIVRDVREDDDE